MNDIRPVVLVTGMLVAALGVAMLIPLAADLIAPSAALRADWAAFARSAIICLFVGGGAAVASWTPIETVTIRQGFLLTAATWIALPAFGALPLAFGTFNLSYTDAFFEAVSGITTTGSTVIAGLDYGPPGALLWRSMLQWFGGVGVIIMAFAVLPALKVGGMQLFKIEAWDTTEKFVANAAQYSLALSAIYVAFTALCFFCLWGFGMSPFDALNHAMTTLSTGGYSTRDASLGAFVSADRAPVDIVVSVFMIIGSLPFGIFLLVLMKGQVSRLFTDSQIQFFLATLALAIAVMFVHVYLRFDTDAFTAFRLASFNVISAITGTGFVSGDFGTWGAFAGGFFFSIMFIGGCAGSTSCGLKIFRLQIAFAAMRLYARRLAHPRGIFVARYNGRTVDDDVFVSVLSFFFIYFASFATIAAALSAFDLDPITAISAAATAISNFGPGLGAQIGPAGNFASLPDGAKLLLCFGMLLGRLEFFALLVLFSPAFWRE